MKRENSLLSTIISALLCAIGIVIPMFAPKIVLEPASFTLASHVPIFIALFISPPVAVAVSLGCAAGFFFAGFPLVVVLRAVSHLAFAAAGSLLLKKYPRAMATSVRAAGFGLLLALLHAAAEVTVVTAFYFGSGMPGNYYAHGYVVSVLLLVGLGTVVHSMVDFGIALLVWKPLTRVIRFPVSAGAVPGRRKEAGLTP